MSRTFFTFEVFSQKPQKMLDFSIRLDFITKERFAEGFLHLQSRVTPKSSRTNPAGTLCTRSLTPPDFYYSLERMR